METGTIRPYGSRVTVAPSPVDETQTAAGIIVPHAFEGSDRFERGVLLSSTPDALGDETLEAGTVVYYRRGLTIHDVILVEVDDILAYER